MSICLLKASSNSSCNRKRREKLIVKRNVETMLNTNYHQSQAKGSCPRKLRALAALSYKKERY